MPLPSYQSLKYNNSANQEEQSMMMMTSSGGSMMMMRRSSDASGGSLATSVSTLNMSALTLNSNYPSGEGINNTNHHSHKPTLKRGWGSTETRKAYTSLTSMDQQVQNHHHDSVAAPRQFFHDPSPSSSEKDWGYFVDVSDEDDDAIMF